VLPCRGMRQALPCRPAPADGGVAGLPLAIDIVSRYAGAWLRIGEPGTCSGQVPQRGVWQLTRDPYFG
jgi:hypothetical protein